MSTSLAFGPWEVWDATGSCPGNSESMCCRQRMRAADRGSGYTREPRFREMKMQLFLERALRHKGLLHA